MSIGVEIGRFVRMHWAHILIAPVMALLVTVIHESAHSAAVLAQGGTVTTFSWLPAAGHWGFMNYEFPDGQNYSAFAISVAPYCVWLMAATTTFCAGLTFRRLPSWLASSLFLWCFVVPLADIANTALPYLRGFENDFRHAFGRPSRIMWIVTGVAAGIAVALGFPLQRWLYGEKGLTLPAYGVLTAVCLAAVVILSGAL